MDVLGYVALGIYIFPIKAGHKAPPLVTPWQEKSTLDVAQIQQWQVQFPGCNWGMDCGKSNKTVLDIDNKPGQHGWRNWMKLKGDHPDVATRSHYTSGKGAQYLFEGAIKAKKELVENVELKSIGGYVVLPPSSTVHIGKSQMEGEYKIKDELPVAPLPEWIREIGTQTVQEVAQLPQNTSLELDQDHHREAAIAHLMQAEPAIEGAGGDNLTYAVAAKCKDLGLSPGSAFDLMMEHWNPRCAPAWEPEELQRKINHAFKYGQNPPGIETPEAKELIAHQTVTRIRSNLNMTHSEELNVHQIKPPDWIIKGRYCKGYITATGAPPGVGKSRISLLEIVAVATGRPLTGKPIRQQGRGLYISTEEPIEDLEERFMGICAKYKLDPKEVPVTLVSAMMNPLNLVYQEGSKYVVNQPMVDVVKDLIKKFGILLVTIDPYSRAHTLAENDNTGGNMVVGQLQQMAQLGCAVHVVHHTTKEAAKTGNLRGNMDALRGASSLQGAARIIHTMDIYRPKLDKDIFIDPDEAWRWVIMTPAKCNLSPKQMGQDPWFRMDSVVLPCHQDADDSVGVAVHAQPTQLERRESARDCLFRLLPDWFDHMGKNDIPLGILAEQLRTDSHFNELYSEQGPLSGKTTAKSATAFLRSQIGGGVVEGNWQYQIDGSGRSVKMVRNSVEAFFC